MRFSKFASAILALALILSVTPAQTAYAATSITVNTPNDELNSDGDCSLREAIETVNTGAQVDNCTDPTIGGAPYTITVPTGTYTLDSGALWLSIYASVTITGNGPGNTIIQASACNPTAAVCGHTHDVIQLFAADITVLFEDLTVRHGHGIQGGGIWADTANFNLILDNVRVVDNKATGFYGGGIAAEWGTLTLQNGTVVDNNESNSDGGGIYFNSDGVNKLTITDSTISNNSSDNDGGGIHVRGAGSKIVLDNVTVSGNIAESYGGGIYAAYLDELMIKNGSLIDNNQATGAGTARGGGLYITNSNKSVVIDASTVSRNQADDAGGGLFIRTGTLTIRNGSVIGGTGAANTATNGGGIYNVSSGITTIDNSTVSYNQADGGDGGGINNQAGGTITIDNSMVSYNQADGGAGGGIYNLGGKTTIDNSTVSYNKIINNGYGGGIYTQDGQLDVQNNSFIDHNEAQGSGGGIYFAGNDAGEYTTISYSTVSNNKITGSSAFGAGIFGSQTGSGGSDTDGILTIEYSTISGNVNENEEGGGVATYGPTMVINHSAIINNVSNEAGDAGVGAWAPTTISNTTISGNQAPNSSSGAGGLGVYNATVTLYNVTITNNSGNDGGGGISDWGESSGILTVYNSIIAGNSDGYGPDCYFENGTLDFADTPSILEDTTKCTTIVNAGSVLNVDPLLDSLADNGGPTNTHAVASALSSAYDASGGSATAGDQRGVSAVGTRDLGAFEYTGDDNLLVVVSSDPPDNSTQQNITQLKVTFSKAVVSGGGATAGDDPGNYLLMEKGANDTFDTLSCVGTAQTDDISINIDTVTYNAASFTATLNINGGTALPNGTYRLFICGTTSIFDLIGLELNGGLSDAQINFTVGNSPVVSAAEILPDTGFAPYRVTELPAQSANLAYTSTEVTLNIPKLGVEMPIVGVPLVDGEWDTAWLNGSAGWLEGSAFPTWAGNTVLTGHVWDAWNRPGAFNNLKDLQHGDQFTISAYGTVYTYEVRSSERVYANDLSVLAHSDYDTVTLLTCEGWSLWTGEYRYRRAVTAVLVSVK